ncbi:MAG: hypothetical protein WDO06_01565 [Actinomycetota bacterium]
MAVKSNGLGLASRRVLSDVVTDDLRDAILSHDLEPGMRIAEDGLAIQLGVSRGSRARSAHAIRARRSRFD